MWAFEAWHWLVFGLGLMMVEMLLTTFTALWFGAAAVAVSLLVWLMPQMAMTAQILIWLALSIILIYLWFKVIRPRTHNRTLAGMAAESLIGQVGMITVAPTLGQSGIVRFSIPLVGSDEWRCRSEDAVAVGDRVRVVTILGNELVVAGMAAGG